jgi:HPt (histidine-containing phosphotransfer) domain-containing protein
MEQKAATAHQGADQAATMQDQLRNLVRTHHVNLLKQIERLGQMLASISAQDTGCAAAIAEAEGLAHQIKGASGSIGFGDVSRAATTLDDHLKSLVALGGDVTAGQVQTSVELFGDLQRVAGSTTPESSTLFNADLSRR